MLMVYSTYCQFHHINQKEPPSGSEGGFSIPDIREKWGKRTPGWNSVKSLPTIYLLLPFLFLH